jgi:nitroimidazol reductase NimA-like FMN-containing flavoprotein (pyridoxamine 5'-phosphate oxidase superfamily)
MIGTLPPEAIERVLRRQHIDWLGMSEGDRIYIFPVAYGYDGRAIYLHSHAGAHGGLKVRLVRARPVACLEVEELTAPAQWQTVLVHGRYDELTTPAARDAALAQIATQAGRTYPPSLAPYQGGAEELVVYRLRILEMTGRFEQQALYDWAAGTAPPV